MTEEKLKHVVLVGACNPELTDENIEAICRNVREALRDAQREQRAEMLSGLLVVANDKSAPADVADAIVGIAQDSFKKVSGKWYCKNDDVAFDIMKIWLVNGIREELFDEWEGVKDIPVTQKVL